MSRYRIVTSEVWTKEYVIDADSEDAAREAYFEDRAEYVPGLDSLEASEIDAIEEVES